MTFVDFLLFIIFMMVIDVIVVNALLFVGVPAFVAFVVSYATLTYFYDEIKGVYDQIKGFVKKGDRHAPV